LCTSDNSFVGFTAGLSVADFKDAELIEPIEYRNKSGVDVSSKQCEQ